MVRKFDSVGALKRPDARHSPRRRVPLEAQIAIGSTQAFSGQVQNISASGVFLQRNNVALDIGAAVEFVLHYQGMVRPLELRIPATVVRLERDGVALRFGRYNSVVYTDLIEVIYNNDRVA
jgi:hypothetical protein